MIRIGVLSDTHLAEGGASLARLVDLSDRHFRGVDLILHAGDLTAPGLLAAFAPCPVIAVRGNMDPASPGIPVKRLIPVEGHLIGLIHGWGPPAGLVRRILPEFAGARLSCLVFGHSHQPMCRRQGDLLLFNPGSATDRRQAPCHTVGLLDVGADIRGTIIPLD